MSEEGSVYKVPLTKIIAINEHPEADRLELATVYGFQVVVKKDSYKVGDIVLYVPIDSIIPQDIEDFLFPADAKIKLHRHRVKQIRIRKLASQGMLISPADMLALKNVNCSELEYDYKDTLGISKYEPPTRGSAFGAPKDKKVNSLENSQFDKFGGLNNIKWFPTMFQPDEEVVLQEKIHGTNARAGLLKYEANTLWKKLLVFFKQAPEYVFCYGSNNVQLQDKSNYKGFYGNNIYGEVFAKEKVEDKLKPGEIIYGEIYGEGVQSNYSYGTKEKKFVLFDVKVNGFWLRPDEVIAFAKERGFDMVPELYRGPFTSLDLVKSYTLGPSVLAPSQKIREGVVVKALHDYNNAGDSGKRALKVISEKYLDKEQSDFH